MYEENNAPVKVGEEIEVKIDAVGEKGDGIARKDGFVLFVPNTKEGDDVRIRVTRVLQKVGFAEVAGESSGQVESTSTESGQEETADQASEDAKSGSDQEFAGQDTDNFGEDTEEDKKAE